MPFVRTVAVFACCVVMTSTNFAQEQGSVLITPSQNAAADWDDQQPADEWWVKETVNPMTDHKSWVLAYFQGGSPPGVQAQFYCDEDEYVDFRVMGAGMNLAAYVKTAFKRSRIDDQEPREDQWTQATMLDTIILMESESLARALYAGRERFVLEDLSGKAHIISLKEFRPSAEKMAAYCPRFLNDSQMDKPPKWVNKILNPQN